MERAHINERGGHTSVTQPTSNVIGVLQKYCKGIQVSPGKIQQMVGAKSSSVKFKHINNELYEMVVVHNGSRQECKIFTRFSFEDLKNVLQGDKKTRDWNVNYTDMRQNIKELDDKYRI